MRIHKLQIQAFGPFAQSEAINFDELADAGLFLLDGPTGAGKSSILDAICYALYGSLPGNRAGSRQIRSDHAAPGLEPQVICELTIGNRRFEVTRSPAWMRPSKRGKNQLTEQKAASLLREFTGGTWEQLSTRNDEVGQVLGGLLGLDRDQFTKVVMLPQGGFADFLRAKAKDREELLANLFDTSDYAAIEEEFSTRLAEERRKSEALESSLAASENAIRSEATGFLAAHEIPGDEAADTEDPQTEPVDVANEFESYQQRIARTHRALADTAGQLRTALKTAREHSQGLGEQVRVFARLQELEQLKDSYTQQHPAAVSAGQKLEHDSKAIAVKAYKVQADEAVQKQRTTSAAWQKSQIELAKDWDFAGSADAETQEKLAELVRQKQSELTLAKDAAADEAGREALVAKHEGLKSQSTVQQKAKDTAEQLVAKLRAERGELELEELDQEAVAQLVQQLRESTQALGVQLEHARTRDKLEKTVAAAESAFAAQSLEVADAQKALVDLQREQLGQSALRLAAALKDGEGCLVCGATEHPHPAQADAGAQLVDDEQIQQLDDVVAAQRAKLATATTKRDVAVTKFTAASEAAAGQTVAELTEQLATETTQLETATQEQTRIAAVIKKIDQLRTRIETETGRASQAALEHTAALKAAEALAEKIADLDAKLDRVRQGEGNLEQLVARLQRAVADYNRGYNALYRYREADAAALKAENTWHKERKAAGFPDPLAHQAALLPDAERAELRDLVTADADRASAISTLKASADYLRAVELNTEGIKPPTEEDLELAAAAVTQADAGYEQARELEVLAHGTASRHAQSVQDLQALRADSGPVIEAYRRLRGLAEVIRGGGENLYKMTLSTYVLAARLEEVAIAASQRLDVMSGGRYSLHHDDSKQGNSKSGLGLRVLDAWTGKHRETQTLSGGETFMASLALALGLADVISHHSGAVDMQTLFVDEGFGSLDAETLEQVMSALENLRAGGRTIGLVSHVAEMKQRITNRVTVVKTQHGSRIEREMQALVSI
ncbi:AAA family ATPase [Glutamicibacter sp. NPDC087344]|uniref:AAA family ATPase n=1 Tax=Glutamicibacter sp. NPDC087344 TaxID=3363994 RepID=UPI003801534C